MKKLLILGLAVVMVVAFTLPAAAFESIFGGYFNVRAFTNQDFSGQDDSAQDTSIVDNRTRLYYTAVLNDNLKLVTKFEMDADWGIGGTSFGDIGADGIAVEVKNAFIDFNVGALRFTIGAQGGHVFGRGFVFDDDYSGVTASFKMGDHLIPFTWARINEGNQPVGTLYGNNSKDADLLALWPVFQLGDAATLNPFAVVSYSDDSGATQANPQFGLPATVDDGATIYWLGANLDATVNIFNLWFTGIYQGGTADSETVSDFDISAWMLAGGASVPLGPAELHGQVVYATGDDNDADDDIENFFGANGQSYYWSEIMGYGTFDDQVSAGSPGNKIGNIWFANIGATIQPMEKLSLTGDIWYAALVEDNANDDDTLGIEVDLKASYQLVEGLNMTVVGAYLFADDATTATAASNDENPWELGTQLSLSF